MERTDYTSATFKSDLRNMNFPHLESREHFEAFYDELGKQEESIESQQYSSRLDFIKPVGTILELGCHSGFNMIHWAHQGFRCIGVDISESLIEAGKRRLESEPAQIRSLITFAHDWIEDYNPGEQFHTIVLTETLEHVIDPLKILKAAKRLLHPDGKLYIAVPESRWGNASHVRGIDRNEMERLIEQAGLKPIWWDRPTNPEETVVIATL